MFCENVVSFDFYWIHVSCVCYLWMVVVMRCLSSVLDVVFVVSILQVVVGGGMGMRFLSRVVWDICLFSNSCCKYRVVSWGFRNVRCVFLVCPWCRMLLRRGLMSEMLHIVYVVCMPPRVVLVRMILFVLVELVHLVLVG